MIRRLQSEKKICVCLFKSLRKLRIGDFGLWALDSCEVQLTNFAEGPERRGSINAILCEKTVCGMLLCVRSEEHTSELQSRLHLVCRLLLEKKKKKNSNTDLCCLSD